MTPEQIKNRHNTFFDNFPPPYSRKEAAAAAQADALYEIALQLSEINQRELEKLHSYNIPGVDGVPPTKSPHEEAIHPRVPFEPLVPLESKAGE